MQFSIVLHIQSVLIVFIGLFQVFPLAFALYHKENDAIPFLLSMGFTLLIGSVLWLITRRYRRIEVKVRESFAIVTFGWITAALFASIPFLIHSWWIGHLGGSEIGSINNFTDAYFEMMSGFSTTGSSILTDIEAIPKGLLFWRSLSHWFGGMGIILLAIAILPALGVGGMQLYQAEVPGPISDKIAPRISQTAQILWGVYLLFTGLETLLLVFGGMDLFDALCHSFGTVATGGFSTKNLSIGYYNSAYIDTIIMIFMFLAGSSFSLHYRFLRGQRNAHIKNKEFLFYTAVILTGTVLIIADTLFKEFDGDLLHSIHYVLFQVISIGTTTGYGVGLDSKHFHFGAWSTFSQFFLIILMVTGGSAGSTAGGVKTLRIYLALKFVYNEIIKFIYPRHIKLLRIGKDVIPDSILLSTLGFLMIHLFVVGLATLIMNFFENNLVTSFTAVISALNNIGPGLGDLVGPTGNFSAITTEGKWLLTFCMLLGRLELYSVIILFVPVAWTKD
ncbi:MAG TPA: TrkH family potassium uptake protein [Spirochaetes bacterium]|nr:TrkH family potassium uptake protein [Spirochaetota bacterium]